jgi:hypothetical protein
VADWPTISSLATAGGTLVLGVATFASVRSGNRAARTAERALQVGLRPVLMPSRFEDPPEKMRWLEGRWATVPGGRGYVDMADGTIFLAMSLRNVGSGIAVLQSWLVAAGRPERDADRPDPERFRRQSRDLYIPPGGTGFWQGGLRDQDPHVAFGEPDALDETYPAIHDAIADGEMLTITLLYSDHEGGQRAMGQFLLTRRDESPEWLNSVIRHWNLDRADPR